MAACTPEMPPPMEEGYVLLPRATSTRLDDPAVVAGEWQGGLSGVQRVALRRLLLSARQAAARQAVVEVGGYLTDAQRKAIVAEVGTVLPSAQVSFSLAETITPVVWLRYVEVMPRRCLHGDGWYGEDGLPPSGCALAMTFGRMVADPNDLIDGRAMGPALLGPLTRDAVHYADQGATESSAPTPTTTAPTAGQGPASLGAATP